MECLAHLSVQDAIHVKLLYIPECEILQTSFLTPTCIILGDAT